jgi:hypothetical protein
VFLDSEVLNYKSWAKQQGSGPAELQRITHKTVIEAMMRQTVRRKL